MDVIARAVAFVEVLVAAQVEQVELVDQAVALEHVQGAVDGDAMDARVEFLRAIQDGAGIEVALGIVHDLEQDFSLARQAHAALVRASCRRPGRSWALIRSPVETRCAVVDMIPSGLTAASSKINF